MILTIDDHEFLIDDDNAHLALVPWKAVRAPFKAAGWYAHHAGRWLHRSVLGLDAIPPRVAMGDHINGNTLDCRRANLRVASASQNQHNARKRSDNSSGVKGVSFDKASGRWHAYIKLGGKQKNLGRFCSKDEAVAARRKAAESLHGSYARHE